jgi:iron complex transport system substrate-binding protein
VVGLRANTLPEVFGCIREVGAAVSRSERADTLIADLRARYKAVREDIPDGKRPRVAVIEWMDPLRVAANWVPEIVAAAGGTYELAAPGNRSVELSWADFRAYDPEVLVIAPCGYDVETVRARFGELREREGWTDLAAVRAGRVYALDGASYLNRWTPRLLDALDRLARMVHPETFDPLPDDVVKVSD